MNPFVIYAGACADCGKWSAMRTSTLAEDRADPFLRSLARDETEPRDSEHRLGRNFCGMTTRSSRRHSRAIRLALPVLSTVRPRSRTTSWLQNRVASRSLRTLPRERGTCQLSFSLLPPTLRYRRPNQPARLQPHPPGFKADGGICVLFWGVGVRAKVASSEP